VDASAPKLPWQLERIHGFQERLRCKLAWKMHRFGRIERKALMLRMIEIASQISGVFAKRPSTNDSPWLLSGL